MSETMNMGFWGVRDPNSYEAVYVFSEDGRVCLQIMSPEGDLAEIRVSRRIAMHIAAVLIAPKQGLHEPEVA